MRETDKGFHCMQCGACCRQTGYVHLTNDDVDRIANYIGVTVEEFTAEYTRLTHNRAGIALKEKQDNSCIFLMADNTCDVNTVKPKQCRDFPYKWHYSGFDKECLGIIR